MIGFTLRQIKKGVSDMTDALWILAATAGGFLIGIGLMSMIQLSKKKPPIK